MSNFQPRLGVYMNYFRRHWFWFIFVYISYVINIEFFLISWHRLTSSVGILPLLLSINWALSYFVVSGTAWQNKVMKATRRWRNIISVARLTSWENVAIKVGQNWLYLAPEIAIFTLMGLSQILLKDSRYSFKFHFVPLKYLLSRILLQGFVQAHESEYSYFGSQI